MALTGSLYPRDNLHMRTGLKFTALNLALTAMLLRALIPTGWMPTAPAAAGAPFVICTIAGPVQPKPAHDADRSHAGTPCVFAAAAPLSQPTAMLDAPLARAVESAVHAARSETAAHAIAYRSASPRAPPAFA